jgi:ABC-type glycerol-3-phosphate transport system substrate-binding protein
MSGFSILGQFARFAQCFMNMVWANGGTYIDDAGIYRMNEQPAVETLQYLADLYAGGLFSMNNHLRNGKAAMTITPTFWRTQLQDSQPASFPDIRSSLLPNNKGAKVAFQYGWGLFVAQKSKNSELAWDFLRWLTMEKSETGFTRMSNSMLALGSMPSNKLDLARKEYRTDPFFQGFVQGLDVMKSEPVLPQQSLRHNILYKTLRPAIEGTVSIAQAMADAQQQINTVLAENSLK